jgi:DNA-binding transcriptional LysR family regulator
VVFDDFDTAKIFVELGLGQAIVPAVHAYNFEKGGSVKAVLIADLPPVAIGWAFRHWHHLSAAAREFVAIADHEIGKLHSVPGLELV